MFKLDSYNTFPPPLLCVLNKCYVAASSRYIMKREGLHRDFSVNLILKTNFYGVIILLCMNSDLYFNFVIRKAVGMVSQTSYDSEPSEDTTMLKSIRLSSLSLSLLAAFLHIDSYPSTERHFAPLQVTVLCTVCRKVIASFYSQGFLFLLLHSTTVYFFNSVTSRPF